MHPLNSIRTRKRKNCLTLLEMSIAFFLVGILLSTLWGLYHNILVTHQKNQKNQIELYKTLFLKKRIDQIAEQLSKPKSQGEKNVFIFTPKEKVEGYETVCFSYQGVADLDPAFNGTVRSLLYLNSLKELCLASWAVGKDPRVEILLGSVKSLQFLFFDPQTNAWREDWPADFSHLPLWMKMKITTEDSLQLIFRLDQSSEPILYLEEQ